MNKKYIAGGVGLVVILIAAIAVVTAEKPAPRTTTTQRPTETQTQEQGTAQVQVQVGTVATTTTNEQPTSGKKQGYTLSDVVQHNSETDCWTAVNGAVYNVTEWISKHPGGKREIIRMCGIDASSAFNGQHGGDARPEKILAGFQIGILN